MKRYFRPGSSSSAYITDKFEAFQGFFFPTFVLTFRISFVFVQKVAKNRRGRSQSIFFVLQKPHGIFGTFESKTL